ncbi:MAG: hypothetical protein ABI644_09930 [Arenimonas sp.]
MHLHSQLKRGYLALIGLLLLGLVVIRAPEYSVNQMQSGLPELAAKTCTAHIKSSWKLASTPIDIDPLLMRKAMICQA